MSIIELYIDNTRNIAEIDEIIEIDSDIIFETIGEYCLIDLVLNKKTRTDLGLWPIIDYFWLDRFITIHKTDVNYILEFIYGDIHFYCNYQDIIYFLSTYKSFDVTRFWRRSIDEMNEDMIYIALNRRFDIPDKEFIIEIVELLIRKSVVIGKSITFNILKNVLEYFNRKIDMRNIIKGAAINVQSILNNSFADLDIIVILLKYGLELTSNDYSKILSNCQLHYYLKDMIINGLRINDIKRENINESIIPHRMTTLKNNWEIFVRERNIINKYKNKWFKFVHNRKMYRMCNELESLPGIGIGFFSGQDRFSRRDY